MVLWCIWTLNRHFSSTQIDWSINSSHIIYTLFIFRGVVIISNYWKQLTRKWLSARREKCEEDLESYWKGVCQSLFELLILLGRPKNPRFLLPPSVVLNTYDRDSSERVSYRNSAISRINPWLGTQDTHVHACVLRIVPEIVLSAHPMYLYPTPFDQLPRRIPFDAIQNTFIVTKKYCSLLSRVFVDKVGGCLNCEWLA